LGKWAPFKYPFPGKILGDNPSGLINSGIQINLWFRPGPLKTPFGWALLKWVNSNPGFILGFRHKNALVCFLWGETFPPWGIFGATLLETLKGAQKLLKSRGF